MKTEKKKNPNHTITIVVLIILIIGLSSYIIYDKFISNNNENITNDTKQLTDEQINKLMSYIPKYGSSPYEKIKDAYSGENHTIDTINEEVLLYMATNNSDTSDVSINVLSQEIIDNFKDITIWNVSDVNETLKTMYNKTSVSIKEAPSPGGIIIKDNSYYCYGVGAGAYGFEKESKIISHNFENNDLIIYEKAGFFATADSLYTYVFDNSYSLHLDSNHENAMKEIEQNRNDLAREYINDNWDLFKTFKHTFKQNKNGDYYWYSTEVQ